MFARSRVPLAWIATACLAVCGAGLQRDAEASVQATPARIIAIDILIEPDATMIAHAKATNAELRQSYPAGFSLDATHAPHITTVQRFVRASDLDQISAAVAKVLETERISDMQLTADGYAALPWGGVSIVAFKIGPSPQLWSFEQKIVDAVQPFAVSAGTADAFVAPAGGASISKETIAWVEHFVPAESGENFHPHVTAGVAQAAFAESLKTKPFQAFTFRPAGVAIYQLGNFGAAQKMLWRSKVE
jgi:hypothetical protein